MIQVTQKNMTGKLRMLQFAHFAVQLAHTAAQYD
jgi:hypothetical protein